MNIIDKSKAAFIKFLQETPKNTYSLSKFEDLFATPDDAGIFYWQWDCFINSLFDEVIGEKETFELIKEKNSAIDYVFQKMVRFFNAYCDNRKVVEYFTDYSKCLFIGYFLASFSLVLTKDEFEGTQSKGKNLKMGYTEYLYNQVKHRYQNLKKQYPSIS